MKNKLFMALLGLLAFCSTLKAQKGEKYPNSLLKEEMIDAPWIVYKDDPMTYLHLRSGKMKLLLLLTDINIAPARK